MKTPIQAIETLGSVNEIIGAHGKDIAKAIAAIEVQWAGIKKIGGVREDHAAALMAGLKLQIGALETFASNVRKRIEQYEANPFG